MYNPNLKPEDTYGNMYAIAIVLEMMETLAVEREFSEKLHDLTCQAWDSLPVRFTIEFPE